MVHTCRNCKRAFTSKLDLQLHQDNCSDAQLFCSQCGERFAERRATRDGWYYRCPTEDCEGQEIGEDLHYVSDMMVVR
ncbi:MULTISPECIES: transcriptional regulator [unclassified Haladaptatus]|uniref:transcriptional regulator n=1 Tax=unclassified Haladaptatus TaxID=2622732 RepID=UPI002FCDE9B0